MLHTLEIGKTRLRRTTSMVLVGILFALGACGRGVTLIPQGAPTPTLACTTSSHISGIDVIGVNLTCHVSGAPASDTSYTLAFTTARPGGQHRTMGAACAGTLAAGSGTCSQTYSLIAPAGTEGSSVAGQTLPDHHPLGPVTPQPAP